MKGGELTGAHMRARTGLMDDSSMVPDHVKRKKITIEALLVWAYAGELVHAARPEGLPAELTVKHRPQLASVTLTKEMVRSSMKMDFEAPPDAYAVHAAVLRLGRVDVALMAAAEGPTRMNAIAGERAPETVTVRVDCRQLVAEHAMRGAAPEWYPRPALRMKRGQVHLHPRSRRPWFCSVTPEGDLPHEVDKARKLYGVWRDSLALLLSALQGGLQRHVLLPDLPPFSPWLRSGA